MKHTELELEQRCCAYARSQHVAAVKLERNGHKGIPDRLFIFRTGITIFVEFKKPEGGGIVSKEQRFWLDFLKPAATLVSDFDTFTIIVDTINAEIDKNTHSTTV